MTHPKLGKPVTVTAHWNIAVDLQTLAVPIGNLKPMEGNPRKGDVNAVVASYRQFGQLKPIVARRNKQMKDGHPTGMVIAGNHQLAAATKLGWTHIAVVWIDTDAKTAKAFALADNRTHDLGKYDKTLLVDLLSELQSDRPLFDATSYTDKALKKLLASTGANIPAVGLTQPDDAPELPDKPITITGSVWALGDHRLICGDSMDPDVWDELLQGVKADMCFTDPPYNVNYGNTLKGQNRARNFEGRAERLIANDNLGEGFYPFLLKACENIIRYTKGGCYICMSSSELHTLQKAWLTAGGHWATFIIWVKNTFTLGRSDYQRQYEPILYGWPEGTSEKHFTDNRSQSDVWKYPKPSRSELHPTMKPVLLVIRAITNSSLPGEIVVDPFGGSGTTLIAAHRLGRICRMIELDPKYCDVIVKRWEEFTGLKAEHIKP